jgi:DNA-binding XRE family transcriptional regulator
MGVVVIPENITEEELESRSKALKALQPPEEPKPSRPRGWAAYWQRHEPKESYEPDPLLAPEELKAFRESKGWFQKHLAQKTGFASKNTIKRMELGQTQMNPVLSCAIRAMMENDRLKAEIEALKAERSQEAA